MTEWVARYPALSGVVPPDSVSRLVAQTSTLALKVAESLPSVASTVVGVAFTALVTTVMVVFALANPVPLVNGVLGTVPVRHRVKAARALATILKQMGARGRATVLIMLATGSVMASGLLLIGVKNWLLFGILAAIGQLIPTIGPIVATVPPTVFALIDSPHKALLVLVLAVIIHLLEGYVLSPFLLGGAGELHPLAVTVGILVFGSVFGLVGAFLTVPFLIVIKAIYHEFYLQDAPNIPDAVAMALISGQVEEQLEREQETKQEEREAREAELGRQVEAGELDLAAALDHTAPDESAASLLSPEKKSSGRS